MHDLPGRRSWQASMLLLAALTVSTAPLLAHRALAEMSPLALASWRLSAASILFGGWALLRQRTRLAANSGDTVNSARTSVAWARLFLAGFCLAAHFLLWFDSLEGDSVARATLLTCTTPLWTALAGLWVRRRPPSIVFMIAFALAGVGTYLVTVDGAGPGGAHGTLRCDIQALGAGLAFALYLFCVEGLHDSFSPREQVSVAYSSAAALLLLSLISQGPIRTHYSPGVWMALAGITLGPQMVGHTLLNASLRYFPSTTVALVGLLEPIFAGALAWAIFGQPLTLLQIVGGGVALLGLGLVLTSREDHSTRGVEI